MQITQSKSNIINDFTIYVTSHLTLGYQCNNHLKTVKSKTSKLKEIPDWPDPRLHAKAMLRALHRDYTTI